jgi:predicted glycoside hydrolase/deacetylase ChbG (UPF0249 family)
MSSRLIVNADDYGRSSEVSRGIREAHLNGVVSSTTCLMNFANIDEDIALALQETPKLGLGVHLVLTAGNPLLPPDQIPTLTAGDGAFPKYDPFFHGLAQIDAVQLKAEWRAQIEKFIRISGQKPTHLDSHHHAAFWSEQLFRTMLELAIEYGCAIRQIAAQPGGGLNGLPVPLFEQVREFVPRLLAEFSPPVPDLFYASFYDEMATTENLLSIIYDLPQEGVFELMCHPGYADEYLINATIYARQRDKELAVLTRRGIMQAITDRQIELATFMVAQV